MFPTACVANAYARRVFNNFAGFMAGWTMIARLVQATRPMRRRVTDHRALAILTGETFLPNTAASPRRGPPLGACDARPWFR